MTARAPEPYVGPRPFEAGEAKYFFGREDEVKDLTALAIQHRTILMYAQSGAGKTSLINAKLIPTLIGEGFTVLPAARVSGEVPAGISPRNVFTFNVAVTLGVAGAAAAEVAALDLKGILERWLAAQPSTVKAPVLIVDQFEELFTTLQDRWRQRERFFEELADAISEYRTLRVCLSMREDWIAAVDPFVWILPRGFDARYRLELLREQAAREAIARPVLEFDREWAPEAVQALVDDLLTVEADSPGGGRMEVREEFVEPVQLQIVCQRIWRYVTGLDRPDRRVRMITSDHLQQFGDVDRAIEEFYETTVKAVADRFGYPEGLIHLECARYVTPTGKRGMIRQEDRTTGRLRNEIVHALEDEHLLRSDMRGGSRWYELSHDRLVAPILKRRQTDRELRSLIRATEILEAAVATLQERQAGQSQVLPALQGAHDKLTFSEAELEFLAKEVLWSGQQIDAWVPYLAGTARELLARALEAGAGSGDPLVLEHVARALGYWPNGPLAPRLLELALDNPEPAVRECAALSLARLDDPGLNEKLFQTLGDPKRRSRARFALAYMRNESVMAEVSPDRLLTAPAARLETDWGRLSVYHRAVLGFCIGQLRLKRGWSSIAYVAGFAALYAAIYTGIARAFPAAFGLTLTQTATDAHWGAGLFQGAFGGIVWGLTIAGSISTGWVLFKRFGQGWLNRRAVANCALGILGGIAGGIVIMLTIFTVYAPASLVAVGWLPTLDRSLTTCLWQTRRCLVHPFYGIFLGLGMAIGISVLHTAGRWRPYVDRFIKLERGEPRITSYVGSVRAAAWLSFEFSFATALGLFVAGDVAWAFFPITPPPKVNMDTFLLSVFGESATILAGGIGGLTGMIRGQLQMRVGIHIKPGRD